MGKKYGRKAPRARKRRPMPRQATQTARVARGCGLILLHDDQVVPGGDLVHVPADFITGGCRQLDVKWGLISILGEADLLARLAPDLVVKVRGQPLEPVQ